MNVIDRSSPSTTCRFRRYLPYATFAVLSLSIGLACLGRPVLLEDDPAFQIKATQQFLNGQSRTFNSVTTPSPNDLSEDTRTWLWNWAPGIPIFYAPAVASGLPLGPALRATSYLLFLLGGIGWLKLAEALKTRLASRLAISLMLPSLIFIIGGAYRIMADVIPFAIVPWLLFGTLSLITSQDRRQRIPKSWVHLALTCGGLGLLWGGMYWIKYSAFSVSLAASAFLIVNFLWLVRDRSFRFRLTVCLIYLVGLSGPILALRSLNGSLGGPAAPSHEMRQWMAFYPAGQIHPAEMFVFPHGLKHLALGLMTVPGMSLFQDSVPNYNTVLPVFLQGARGSFKVEIVGIAGTILVIWLLYRARKLHSKSVWLFGVMLTFLSFALLGVASITTNGNLLLYGYVRYGTAFFPFTQIFLVDSLVDYIRSERRPLRHWFAIFTLALFILIPSVMTSLIGMNLVKGIPSNYVTTRNDIFVPFLSNSDSKSVVERIGSLASSPLDVVVLVNETGSKFGEWVELKQRALPLTYFWIPFAKSYGPDRSNPRGSTPFITSRNLRLVLVVPKYAGVLGELPLSQITLRFPQASEWKHSPDIGNANVSLLYADLRPEAE